MLPSCCRRARHRDLLAALTLAHAPAPFLLPSVFFSPSVSSPSVISASHPPPSPLPNGNSTSLSSISSRCRHRTALSPPTSSIFSTNSSSALDARWSSACIASTSQLPLSEQQHTRAFSTAPAERRVQPKPTSQDATPKPQVPKTSARETTTDRRLIDGPKLVPPAAARPHIPPDLLALHLDPLPTSRGNLLRLLQQSPRQAPLPVLLRLVQHVERISDSAVAIALAQAFISSGDHSQGRAVLQKALQEMRKAGRLSRAAVATVEGCLSPLWTTEAWEHIIEYTDVALKHGVVSRLILQRRIGAFDRLKRPAGVVSTFALFELHHLDPDGNAYDRLVHAHLQGGELALAQAALAEKGDKGLPTSPATVLALFDGMVNFGGNVALEERILQDDEDHNVLREQRALKQDVRVLNRLMSVRAHREDTDGALAVLNYFALDGLNLPSLALPGSPMPPSRSVSRTWWRPAPDIATFAILIGIALRRRLPDAALQLFVQSQQLGVGLNDHLIAAVVSSLLVVYRSNFVVEFVLALPAGTAKLPGAAGVTLPSFRPGPRVYTPLVRGILADQGARGVTAFVGALERTGQRSILVQEEVLAMVSAHVALHQRKQPHSIAAIVKNLQTEPKVNPTLKAAWVHQRFSGPHRRRRARSLGLTADDHRRATEELARLYTTLEQRGVLHDRETVQNLLRNDEAFSSVEDMWRFIQQELINRGILPNWHHITVLLRAHVRRRDLVGARQTLERAVELGVPRHVAFYSVLLGGASRFGQFRMCDTIYAEMKRYNLVPDRPMYLALALSHARRGDVDSARAVVAEGARQLHPPLSEYDPVVLCIIYRAQVVHRQARASLEAQALVRLKLAIGLVPDRVVYLVLNRTRRYLRRKILKSGGRLPPAWGRVWHRNFVLRQRVREFLNNRAENEKAARRKLLATLRPFKLTASFPNPGKRDTVRRNQLANRARQRRAMEQMVEGQGV